MSSLQIDYEQLITRARKGVRTLFPGVRPIDSSKLPHVVDTKYVDTGIEPSRELLVLREARDQIIMMSGYTRLKEGDRNVVFSHHGMVVPIERHLLNLEAGPRYSKFELDIQRVTDTKVGIVALMCTPKDRRKAHSP